MADLFDIANLITTVGVDAVKIKPEPGLPEKSSNEILTELFSTFDADEGIVSPAQSGDEIFPTLNDLCVKVEKSDKVKTRKKSKKKHRHKEKKQKKKSKRNSSDSETEAEDGTKKRKKHKKKTKRRRGSASSKSSESDEHKPKIQKLDSDGSEKAIGNDFDIAGRSDAEKEVSKLLQQGAENTIVKEEPGHSSHLKQLVERENSFGLLSPSPKLPFVSNIIDKDDLGDVSLPRLIETPKPAVPGKILIKDLKNSLVYSEVVKEVENKAREKAARMEDGELSDSSGNNRTPTLSPSPSRDDRLGTPSLSPESTRSNGLRSPSPSPRLQQLEKVPRDDLRMILKEKEKKRLGEIHKTKLRNGKDRTHSRRDSLNTDRDQSERYNRRSGSRDGRISKSKIQSRSRRSRSNGKEKSREKSRDRIRDREKSRDRWERERSRERRKISRDGENGRYRSRSRDRSRDRRNNRGRSRSRERKERIEIDKKKLLEIARKNAINMIQQGTLPLSQQDKAIAAIQAGGKSVDELTDFCKSLSKSEAMGELSSISSDEDGSNSEKGFHHPFLVKDRPNSIIMNIRDAKQLPTKTFQEKTAESSTQLRLQFPVSSGQHHRITENQWVPVSPKKPEPKKAAVPAATPSEPLAIMPPPPAPVPTPVPAPVAQPPVFTQPSSSENVDIGCIVSQRLAAMRKLRENPNDVQALTEMYRAQSGMKTWAESKQMPGQFTGNTGVKILSASELSAGYQAWARKVQSLSGPSITNGFGPTETVLQAQTTSRVEVDSVSARTQEHRCQKKFIFLIGTYPHWRRDNLGCPMIVDLYLDQLLTAQPVSGGMGMALLQKMGWRPGEGLGKNKEGTLVPLQLEVKLDKRGLVSDQDIGQRVGKTSKPVVPTIKTLEGKHPVSLLGEYCSKRKFGAPVYELCFECGPDHRKNFLFKVKVNGIEYKPSVASPNKKQAKAEAAQICLQTLGLLAA